MRPVTITVSSLGASVPVPLSLGNTPFNIGLGAALSVGANLTYKVQHTFDNVYSPTFNAATATWYDHATLTGKTASADGNYAFPVMAIRLNVTAYVSGSVTLSILSAGLI